MVGDTPHRVLNGEALAAMLAAVAICLVLLWWLSRSR